jgi:hypothetical protein
MGIDNFIYIFWFEKLVSEQICRNLSLGFVTKAKFGKGAGQ